MMWKQIENEDGYHRLSIEADWAELAAEYDDIVTGFAKVRLPGFRQGKGERVQDLHRLRRRYRVHATVDRTGLWYSTGTGDRIEHQDKVRTT